MKKSARARKRPDPQCKRIYQWQWDWFDWNRATIKLPEARAIAAKACKMWGVHTPPVNKAPKSKAYSCYEDGNRTIRLLPDHMNPAMVLHEVAHHIVDVRQGTWAHDHGAEFLGVFADLLVTFKVAPQDAIYLSLKKRRLKFNKTITTVANK